MDRRHVIGALAGVSIATAAFGQKESNQESTDVHIPTNEGFRTLKGKEAAAYHAAHTWLTARMKEAESIAIGSTYADVIKVFRTDGGLSTLAKHRFVLILCPFVKVDLEFEKSNEVKAKHSLPVDAKVVSVSRVYFEREFLD